MAAVLGLAAVVTCQSAFAGPVVRSFEARHFTGLTATLIEKEEDAALDLDFDQVGGGLLRVGHCREVSSTLLDQVVPSQAVLAEILRLNCLAVHRYAASQSARRNHLPPRWSVSAVTLMPASLLHSLGPSDEMPAFASPNQTLGRTPGARRITLSPDGSVRVTGKEVIAVLHRLAQADLDGDGNQDWLLRVDWAARHGDARGTDLLIVTRQSARGRLTIAERVTR